MSSPDNPISPEIQRRVIRFNEMIACKTAFIDAKTPGSDKKENFCLIGEGVAENPDQVVHINIPHGFDIGGARQPHGCKNSHHSHDTEEVFFVHRGQWLFTWGHDGSDGSVTLFAGDTISIPTGVFRGFENVGPDDGFLYAILGLNADGSAGHVAWAPYVYEDAKTHGLVLLDDGRLIDTSNGTAVPKDGVLATPTSTKDLDRFITLTEDDMANCVARNDEALSEGGLSCAGGITEKALIGPDNAYENIGHGKMKWPHGFQVRRLTMQAGTSIKTHRRFEEEVLFVHKGSVDVTLPQNVLRLSAGDVFTVPIDMPRAFNNASRDDCEIVVVRRGNQPKPAEFL